MTQRAPDVTSDDRRAQPATLAQPTRETIARHAVAVPRYTSYPTANHFSAAVDGATHAGWLAALPDAAALSLYAHIPFCQAMCWYCGCSTKAVRRYEPVGDYLGILMQEVAQVASLVPSAVGVAHIHLGGGSPDILKADDVRRLGAVLRNRFRVRDTAEVAIEIDPRLLSQDQVSAFAEIGINRASIGVQDFDEDVQKAIGRMQSFDETRRAVEMLRASGITSINLDLVYGLPRQSVESVARTIRKALALAPDRIAIFGYAHLPQRFRHQRLIDEAQMPDAADRFAQSRALHGALHEAGFAQVGLDHFARPGDALAGPNVARNFQGYTTDQSDALIGLGASAISRLPQGFSQNAVPVDDYGRRIAAGDFATVRGHAMTADDHLRAFIIERLMCDFTLSWHEVERRFGDGAATVREDARRLLEHDRDGFIVADRDGFTVTPEGRPFVRTICAGFDAYLAAEHTERRHALAV